MNPEPAVTFDASEAVTPESLRKQYESGATVDELVAASGLSYGTVLNRLHEAGTEVRTSWQTRRMRQDPQARRRLAAHLRALYEQHGATLTELAAAGAGTPQRGPPSGSSSPCPCGHGTRPAPPCQSSLRTATTPWPRSTGSCPRPALPCDPGTATAPRTGRASGHERTGPR
jgi:hypothetical protein